MAIRFNRLTFPFAKVMMDSRTVYVDGVGPVTLKHSNRVEKTTLSATPDKGVSVSVPVNVSFETAVEFVNQNEHWIRNKLYRVK
jgi:predicted metal-dependent hydrolase